MNTQTNESLPSILDEMPDLQRDVVLVSMPWAVVHSPSIQLGLLQACLEGAGVSVASASLSLDFVEFMSREALGFDLDEYEKYVSSRWAQGVGEWVFAVAPYVQPSAEADAAYFQLLREAGYTQEDLDRFVALRAAIPRFLHAAARGVLVHRPKIVGFSSTFSQNVPSLALARILKDLDPELHVVFGGANVSGPMGRALLEGFDWVDCVVDGEAEASFPAYVRGMLDGEPIVPPGVVVRDAPVAATDVAPSQDLDSLPVPNFDEYFARLSRCSFWRGAGRNVRLPLETARGCWWGQKNHCTFCGLNGDGMRFRAKSPEAAVRELTTLAERYQVLEFDAVDNIIDMKYLKTVLPELSRAELDLELFYETKANLSRTQLEIMHDAGIRKIQPGIESLDTSILRLMNKGTTATQNVRLLKWCAEVGITPVWNILCGFGGEEEDAYRRMTELCTMLTHLAPPNATGLLLNRYSPMFERPADHGFSLEGPLPYYQHVYPTLTEQQRFDIAYFFDHHHLDGRALDYTQPLRDAVERWRAGAEDNFGKLIYRRGPGFIRVTDRRKGPGESHASYVLQGPEADIYEACDAGMSAAKVLQRLDPGHALSLEEVTGFLDTLVEARLMCKLDGKYLSLAILDRRVSAPAASKHPAAPRGRERARVTLAVAN